MSEIMDLTVIEIKPEQAPSLYRAGGLDAYLEQIRQAVNEVPDLTTKKGRDRVASLAAQVSRSKTAIEKPGREYLKRLKEAVRPAEAEIKRFVDACDELRDATRKPLTEWEAEQERIKAEEAMNALHAEALAMNEEFDRQLAARIESDHEMALLMNDAFDREQAEKKQKPSASALPAKKRSSARQKRKRNVRQQNRHSVKLTLQPPESAKRFWPKSEPSANSEKQLNVLSVKSRPPWKQNAARHRKKPIASAARQSNANWPAWRRRSARPKKNRAAPLMLNIAAE